MYDQYKDVNETAFLFKLGIKGEEIRQNRDLNELVQNMNGNYFRGLWLPMQNKGRYIVTDNNEPVEHNIKMPRIHTRVVLWVDPVNPQHPDSTRLRSLKALVVDSRDAVPSNEALLLSGEADRTENRTRL